ncbi:hypothetical protein ACU4GD_28210 [Cupriavidus basilensis]
MRITRTSDVTQWMDGQVSAYDAATGALTVLVATDLRRGHVCQLDSQPVGSGRPAGADGQKGWSPVFAVAVDGARRVMKVADWSGWPGR